MTNIPPKRKTRRLLHVNNKMSAYDRIYHPSDISNSDEENSQREMSDVHQSAWHTENIERQNETPSVTVQSNLNERIKRIQNSIDKAQSMLDTVEKNNNMRTDGHEQREKLRSILFNLKAQKLSYLKLLNSDEDKKTVLTCRHVELPLTQSSSEENLLSDINKLRDRLKLLRFLYEQKQNQADKQIPANLDEIRQQLNELEEMVNETSNFFVSSTSAISQENKNNFQHPTIDSTHQINTSESTHNDPSDTDQFTSQLRNLSHCLFMFIEEQKKFNHQIEERLLVSIKPSTRSNSNQALLADLETAYRQITVLQSEINALQSENTRLLSSLSFEQQYHHCSKNSLKYASGNLRTTDEQKLPSSRTPLSKSHDRELREFPVVKVNSEEIRCQNQNQQRLSMESIGLPRPIPVQTKYPLVETKTTSKSDSTAIEVSTKIDIQLLSFLRLHLNEKFNKYLLDLIRDQTFCLIKDQIGLTSSIELNIEQMFSNKLNKYLGLSVRKQGITFLGDLSQIVQQILLGNFQRNEQNQSERMGFDPDILTSLNPSAEPNFNRHEYIFVH